MTAEKQGTPDLRRAKAEIIKSLIEEFQEDSEYREGYTEDFFNAKIATQIKVLREQREWSQEQLGEESGMRQERISVLEDVSYESWTASTLRKLASAFHLVVDIEFKEYGEFLDEFSSFSEDKLRKRKFENDPVFEKKSIVDRSNKSAEKENVSPDSKGYSLPNDGAVASPLSRVVDRNPKMTGVLEANRPGIRFQRKAVGDC